MFQHRFQKRSKQIITSGNKATLQFIYVIPYELSKQSPTFTPAFRR